MRCLSLNGHVRDLLILEQSAPDPGQEREKEGGGGEEEEKSKMKGDWREGGGWMKTEKQSWLAAQDPTERWKIKYENEGELGGVVDQESHHRCGQKQNNGSKMWDWPQLEETKKQQQPEGAFRLILKINQVEIAWAGWHLKKGSGGQTRERILKR